MKILKKIIILFLLSITFFYWNSYADEISVTVPINLGPMWLSCDEKSSNNWYTCKLQTWFWSAQTAIWTMIKYFTFITWLLWVLFIIISWIWLSMSWLSQDLSKLAKESLIKSIIGVIVLLLSWVILNFIAPWVYN